MAIRTLLSVLLLSLLSIPVIGENELKRPRVGLVLSGGGAKGIAHVGVLKVLEEVGIRPDFITGTSMGSVVGGLYAIGYTAFQLDSIVNAVDWGQLLSDGIPLSDVVPEEKHDYHRFHVELDVTKEGLKVPSGFVSGSSISEFLTRLSWNTAGVNSFTDYPIPFKCVASDLISGEQYVFDQGDFASALRASMAIPSLFSPIELDSMLLVDGGVLNNFPILLCKEMGADIIIGVNVGTVDNVSASDFNMPGSILATAAMIGSQTSMRMQLHLVDILITPELHPFTAGSFFDGPRIIERGEQAARASIEQLQALALYLDSIGPPTHKQPPPIPKKIRIDKIQINGIERISHNFIIGNLGINEGDSIVPVDLSRGISRLLGTRYFVSVTYNITPLRKGYLLTLNIDESERMRFKFSLHYDNENKAGIITNLTLRNILLRGNRLAATLDISEKPRFNTSIINYHGEFQRTASKMEFNIESNSLPIYHSSGLQYGTLGHNYASASVGLMSSLKMRTELNGYFEIERIMFSQENGFYDFFVSGVNKFGNSFLSANFSITRNSYNRRYFPTGGSELYVRYKHYVEANQKYKGSEDGLTSVEGLIEERFNNSHSIKARYQSVYSLHKRFAIIPRIEASYSSHKTPVSAMSFIGGMPFQMRINDVSFAGLSSRELIVQDFAIAQINIRYRFMNKMHISGIANAMISETPEVPRYDFIAGGEEQIIGYGLLWEYDSFLGPARVGVSNNNKKRGLRWYVGLGYSF